MSKKIEWKGANDAKLRQLWESGNSFGLIAQVIGCSRNSAIGRAHRLGLRGSNAGPEQPINRRSSNPQRPPVIREPKSISIPLPEPVNSGSITLLEAQHDQCRYPTSGIGETLKVCGANVVPLRSWCPEHFKTVFQPAKRNGP